MNVRYLGTSDDVTTCDCCGRANLKSTVGLSIDDGDPVYFGVVCAAKALRSRGLAVTTRMVRLATAGADAAARDIAAAERAKVQKAERARWFAWLDVQAPSLRGDVFRQIESLGGFVKANAAYTAHNSGVSFAAAMADARRG